MALDFRPAREVHERALAILEAERAHLMALLPWGELSLTGGSSLPEALTRGDVDLLLRVPPADFEPSVRTLGRLYRPVSREMWTAEFATFELDGHVLPTGIAVTIADGEHDRYALEQHVERVVGFDRREPLGIELKPPLLRDSEGVERLPPMAVHPA